ncbi:amidase [Lentibacillus salinarum]|uniref:Amidase n=1 Tax=Lentibacillus salinarum TaxID=446820 RepID=A0ABW3ZP88_9BACI
MRNELLSKSVEELATLIETKAVSPVDLTKVVLDHAEEKNEAINAYLHFSRKHAEKAAKDAEEEILNGQYRGMYHGIPMALKDNLYVKNELTTMGSKIHKDFIPDVDATVVKKLKEAGAVLTGKLNMHEYAWGITTNNPHYGATKNPWHLEKIPGGSSGGSAAAVAADMSAASLGTDTAGSIRIPASASGIVGLKPTYGRVSNHGSFPLAWSLDHIGPMTKTVKDSAGLLEIISGYDKNDPTTIDLPVDTYTKQLTGNVNDLVIGVNEEYFFNQIDSDIDKRVRESIQRLVNQGAKVEEVTIPTLKHSEQLQMVTNLSEATAIHHTNLLEKANDFGHDIPNLYEMDDLPSVVDYLQAQQLRKQLKQDFQKAFEKVDVLMAPTLPIMPPNIGEAFADLNGEKAELVSNIIRLTSPGNLTGLPALTVPCGFKDDMPVGVHIMGPAFSEGLILNTGYAVEQTNPFKDRKPNL